MPKSRSSPSRGLPTRSRVKKTHLATAFVALPCVLASLGCGGGAKSDGSKSAASPTAPTNSAADERAARGVVQRWVDKDDCSAITDSYVESAFADSGGDPRTACENDETQGLRSGEYQVVSASVNGDSGAVVLKTNFATQRRYTVVREGKKWLIDGVTEKVSPQRADVGKPLRYVESFELNGEPIDARLTVTVLSLRVRQAPPYTPTKAGRHWLAMRVRIHSSSSDKPDISVEDSSP
jgi:hypothetical protein